MLTFFLFLGGCLMSLMTWNLADLARTARRLEKFRRRGKIN